MKLALFAVLGPALLALTACPSEVVVHQGNGGDAAGGNDEGGQGTGGIPVINGGAAEGGSISTGGAGGIGEPSDVYPAPHPDPPAVVNLGGPVMNAPVLVPVYFSADDQLLLSDVSDFINQVGSTNYWAATTSEYGVGPASSLPAVVVNEVAPLAIDDEDIQVWLAAKLNANDPAFPVPTENTLFALYYPQGTTVTLQGSVSCQEFGAYHSNLYLDSAHGNLAVPYAIMPRCGEFGGFTGADALTIPTSHELIEAATDPLPLNVPAYGQTDDDHIMWSFILGGEVSDLCAQSYSSYTSFPGDIDFAVQRSWSNLSAFAGHNPCVPLIPGEVYFNAAPVLDDTIFTDFGFSTKGVKIAEGETRTIDVKLFSDAPMPAFDVYPEDVTYYFGGGSLDVSLDEYAGQNGQTLHLTIRVNQAGDYGFEAFMLRASDNSGQENVWIGLVGN